MAGELYILVFVLTVDAGIIGAAMAGGYCLSRWKVWHKGKCNSCRYNVMNFFRFGDDR